MKSELYWIEAAPPGRLAILPRPRSGEWLEDEIRAWRKSGLDLIISLLEPEEIAELGLDQEPALCVQHEIEFRSWPIRDRGTPAENEKTILFLHEIATRLKRGQSVGIHCRAGIGRSGLLAAALLLLNGSTADDALDAVSRARGVAVPDTEEQKAWVYSLQEQVRHGPRRNL